MTYNDIFLTLSDGIKLHLREWPAQAEGRINEVLCLHGLTRNAADFDEMAQWLSRQSFHGNSYCVRALTFRGRGLSDRDSAYLNYHPMQYVQDVKEVLALLGIEKTILIGTSLGGIVSMLTAAQRPAQISALLINDVGPTLAPEGLARIGGYVGGTVGDAVPIFENWQAAEDAVRKINDIAFPGTSAAFWAKFTRNICREHQDGIVFDYDPAIAKALGEVGPAPDLWPAFKNIACPLLVTRGALSDLLTAEITQNMQRAVPHMVEQIIPQVGHAPFLNEPAALSALASFLSELPQ